MALLGLDVGGTFIKMGIVNGEELIHHATVRVETRDYEAFLNQLLILLEDLNKAHHAEFIGIGLPGTVSFPDGKMMKSPHLPFLTGKALKDDLPAEWAERILFGNDVTLAAYGEYRMNPEIRKLSPTIMIYLAVGTGLGGGILVNGRILWGAGGFAGEFGHMSINPQGPRCTCGSFGCLELYTSSTGILRLTQETLWKYPDSSLRRFNLESLKSEDVFEAARFGDTAARAILEQSALAFGVGLGAIINIFNPNVIVVGGGVTGSNEFFLQRSVQLARGYAFDAPYRQCKILPSHLRYFAGVWGAAFFARDYLHKPIPQPG